MATLDRDRLAKLLGMLGSDHDGEVAAAGRAVSRMLRECGNLTWHEVLGVPYGELTITEELGDADAILRALDDYRYLTEWESGFVRSIRDFVADRGRLTEKQRDVLDRILERIKLRKSDR